jgi:hypothetical protein
MMNNYNKSSIISCKKYNQRGKRTLRARKDIISPLTSLSHCEPFSNDKYSQSTQPSFFHDLTGQQISIHIPRKKFDFLHKRRIRIQVSNPCTVQNLPESIGYAHQFIIPHPVNLFLISFTTNVMSSKYPVYNR